MLFPDDLANLERRAVLNGFLDHEALENARETPAALMDTGGSGPAVETWSVFTCSPLQAQQEGKVTTGVLESLDHVLLPQKDPQCSVL